MKTIEERIAEFRQVINTDGIPSQIRHLYEKGIKQTCRDALEVIDELKRAKDQLEMDLAAAQEIIIELKRESEWRLIDSMSSIKEGESFLILTKGNDACKNLILQVQKFEGQIYADYMDFCISWSDRICHILGWRPLPNPT